MKRRERLSDWLVQIGESAALALEYVDGLEKRDFLVDRRTQHAVTMNLVIIGELANRLLTAHAEFADRHPQLPWRAMKGMRNQIAHGYFELDLDVIWDTVQLGLPELLRHMPGLLADATSGPDAGGPQ